MLKDIIEVKPLNNYQLYLKFQDNQEGIINLEEIIDFVAIFQPLKDLDFLKLSKLILIGEQFIGKMGLI
jgi:Protein of unknown function (DUF2442)